MKPRRPLSDTLLPTLLCLSTLLVHTGACRSSRPPESGGSARKPRLHLTSTAASGFAPLSVVLMGRLSDIALDDVTFADPAEKWTELYGELESVSEREPGQGRADAGNQPRLFFERTMTLTDPGQHRFQLTIRSSDGRTLHSNWVSVRVVLRY